MFARDPAFLAFFLAITGFLFPQASARAAAFTIEGDTAGTISRYTVQPKDTLSQIARRFDLGIVELRAANPGADPRQLKAGEKLILPLMHILPAVERKGIVLNLSTLRLFYFPDPRTVVTFPVSIGKEGWETLTGTTTVVKKRENPAWIPPDSIRAETPDLPGVVPPGPDNPLGTRALYLGWPGTLIHGTNSPASIGKRVSHGCIRLYPEDITALFDAVKEGTPVTVIDAPYEIGWRGDRLFLEVMLSQTQSDAVAAGREMELSDIPEIYKSIGDAAGTASVDWHAVRLAVIWRDGVPLAIAARPGIAEK